MGIESHDKGCAVPEELLRACRNMMLRVKAEEYDAAQKLVKQIDDIRFAASHVAEKCVYPEECAKLKQCIRPDDHDSPPPCRGNPYGTTPSTTPRIALQVCADCGHKNSYSQYRCEKCGSRYVADETPEQLEKRLGQVAVFVDAVNPETPRSATPRSEPVGWVLAVKDGGYLSVRGPQYHTREAAEQDAKLPRARGLHAEVWECFRSPDGGKETNG